MATAIVITLSVLSILFIAVMVYSWHDLKRMFDDDNEENLGL